MVEWLDKLYYIHTIAYYTVIIKNKLLSECIDMDEYSSSFFDQEKNRLQNSMCSTVLVFYQKIIYSYKVLTVHIRKYERRGRSIWIPDFKGEGIAVFSFYFICSSTIWILFQQTCTTSIYNFLMLMKRHIW